MDAELQRYINDHLAGASGAIDLIRSLVETSEEPEESHFFRELEIKVERDRDLLKGLLEKMGRSSSTLLEIAGNLSSKAGRLKLMWEGLKPGELGRFEAMEMLAIGIQGKRLLWVMLGELAPWIPEWEGIVFSDLELDAISQRDAVEARRIESGLDGLLDVERGARKGRIQSRMETL
ncbi:hypothetical protein [Luteolibacter luteus]|jgi:hypothetical protein|uniref:Uncharacterized protein n=1 Tax=Luteolibacter luteus TaxID=2728835 RepID=A0A858REV3_9BACT|nr:hypothetical protein [Luteolibacter luteus]QJE95141.1 hypothetical protein HHL09_04925 [Luteolibacter luteus]